MTSRLAVLALAGAIACASPQQAREVLRIGPGVTPPNVISKPEPEYTEAARNAKIQGKAVFDIVVDETGTATDIELVSPLGYGLDENAEATIRKWRFEPGKKDGKPVAIAATVEVNFQLLDIRYDEKLERQRTAYNVILRNLRVAGREAKAVEGVRELAKQKFVPAMFLFAMLMEEAKLLPANPGESYELLKAAAAAKYAPAMHEIARRHLAGTGSPADEKVGLQMMKDAASLGSILAQLTLGLAYEQGEKVEQDADRARKYYRLCAAGRNMACQFRLGRSLLLKPQVSDREVVQAMAWLEISAEQGNAQAEALLAQERQKRSIDQLKRVPAIKRHLTPAK